jgi:hypothetical protein
MTDERNEIEIRLNTIEELFAEPAADPFDPQSRYQSGIEEIAGQLRLTRQLQAERLVIRLPAEAMEPDLLAHTKAALGRYCAAKVRENQQAITEARYQGRRDFISSLIITGLVIAVTAVVVYFNILGPLSTALSYMVAIILWVVLWDPIWTYVYGWRPYQRERQLYENLKQAEVVIEAQA